MEEETPLTSNSPPNGKVTSPPPPPPPPPAEQPTPVAGVKRRRTGLPSQQVSFEAPYAPASLEEKSNWQGFCEIESDPAIFNNLLRGLGVKGAKLQEIYSLDEDQLAFLPKPVFGLIFLFQYSPELVSGEVEGKCPANIWFANQVAENCCATVALTNMVNNIPTMIDLGAPMRTLREHTMLFTPAYRGDAIVNSRFIKTAHNLYARKIDMINADALMEEKWSESRKKRRVGGKANSRKKKIPQGEDAFHFVAYMPIDGNIWALDGLQNNPQKFADVMTDDWIQEVAPLLTARMADCADQSIEFNLLALLKDPYDDKRTELIQNLKFISSAEEKLNTIDSEWKSLIDISSDSSIPGTSPNHDITKSDIEAAILTPSFAETLAKADEVASLIELRQQLIQEQLSIRGEVQDLVMSRKLEETKALDRQNDYVPLAQRWFQMLAENQVLRDVIESP
ncbi:cysteine proteinase [Microthyrium microscopicum]|uniref:Ubiquitin carboxyl-terminal hydrolase n=1 Tax=Microthyrium microscopicum TaxID=703497 RepID=A0A6A6U7I0_9PEZI|nr:cysteine proteinase [Microthyrium microscopicum]